MKLKFAIIGYGRIGKRHAKHIANVGELVGVCDINEDAFSTKEGLENVNKYASVDELLDSNLEIDVIAVCSPNGLHAQHTIQCLKAGLHVICEKPMALSSYDCGEMIKQAESSNKRLFIVKQNRFNPPVAELKKLLEEGRLGKIYSLQLNCFWNRNNEYYQNSWKGSKDLDGGTLYTQFSHFVDLLYWLFGDVEKVNAMGKNYQHKDIIEFEDTGVVNLKFKSGAIGCINYTVNSFNKNMEGSLTVFGSEGTIKIGGQYLNELEYQEINNYTVSDLPEGNKPNNYGKYQGSMSNHDKVYENVVNVLNNGGSIATNGFEGLKTVEIIEEIYESMSGNS